MKTIILLLTLSISNIISAGMLQRLSESIPRSIKPVSLYTTKQLEKEIVDSNINHIGCSGNNVVSYATRVDGYPLSGEYRYNERGKLVGFYTLFDGALSCVQKYRMYSFHPTFISSISPRRDLSCYVVSSKTYRAMKECCSRGANCIDNFSESGIEISENQQEISNGPRIQSAARVQETDGASIATKIQ